jgi:pimeloyl-ACP methyl ester carboxylesterase
MTASTPGQQPRLVFVHGFIDGPAAWDDVISALGADSAGALTVTLAGMGERAGEAVPASLAEMADDVRRKVQAMNGPVVLVGHSLGAQVAELAAAQMPGIVRTLVLLTPVPLAGMGLSDQAMTSFHALGGNAAAQRQVRRSLSVNLDPERLEKLGRLGDRVAPAAVGALADLWNRGDAAGRQPSAYRGPVVIVRGAGDGFITAETVGEPLLARFEQVRVEVVDGAGHWPHVEQAQAIARILAPLVAAPAVAPQGWTRAFAQKSTQAFGDAFAPDMVLEASVLTRPVVGADKVKTVMGTASGIYELVTFTHQATEGLRDYLEWEARAFGGEMLYGITILTKNDQGKVVRAAIHHRPLGMALKFSAELGRRLQGSAGAGYFFGE